MGELNLTTVDVNELSFTRKDVSPHEFINRQGKPDNVPHVYDFF